jgi:NAD(P)-dependent dehydrogenase (short-subunit alcohol dehydrogenase family)
VRLAKALEVCVTAEMRDITGTVVAVTGASSGIGASAGRLLVAAGARVAVQARRKERLASLVEELGEASVVAVPGEGDRRRAPRHRNLRHRSAEISIIGSMAVLSTFEPAMRLMTAGAIAVPEVVTHAFPLAGFASAVDAARA